MARRRIWRRRLFERLGAQVDCIGCAPDGRNINLNCGSQHLEGLAREGARNGRGPGGRVRWRCRSRDVRFAFGQDRGRRRGDAADARCRCTRAGRLTEVVATVMSNLGLERALKRTASALVRTPVGDKYVLEEMVKRDAPLGGEQSGHVIFRDYATTGDGLLTALRVLEVMRESGQDLDALDRGTGDLSAASGQRAGEGTSVRWRSWRRSIDEIRRAESEFGDAGRVLVRFSGTEPLARVMVEGPESVRVEHFANSIAAAIRSELGLILMQRRLFYCDHYRDSTARRAQVSDPKISRCCAICCTADGVLSFRAFADGRCGDHQAGARSGIRRAVYHGNAGRAAMRRIGFPWSEGLVRRTLASAGGTLGGDGGCACNTDSAERSPVERIMRFAAEGAGFCVFNDVAIAIYWLRSQACADARRGGRSRRPSGRRNRAFFRA